ncbi:MAG: AGE family epimerase/isomerase [Acholeplasmataceae bacterium]|nr:AGE family epimerase/isomerase [Acholeplasmataceae bacterium]
MSLIEEHLKELMIPFWLKLKDDENGGFYGYLSNDLKLTKEANKSLISQSRHLFTFSLWYEYFHFDDLKKAANHAYKFIKEAFYDYQYGGYFWEVTFDKKSALMFKNIYGHAFVIYGLSEYGRVFNDENAIDEAYQTFLLIEKYSYNKVCCYYEQFDREWNRENGSLTAMNGDNFPYTTNTLLHLLEAYTNLYRVKKEELLRKRILEMINVFKNKLYNKKKGSFYLYFDENKRVVQKKGSYGHDIEACWLIDRTISTLNIDDKELDEIVLKVTESVYQNALTKKGLITELNGDDKFNKIWWVQVEAMVGFYNHYQKTNDKKYLKAVKSIYKFINKYLVDKRPGSEWFWGVDNQGNPLNQYGIVDKWKASYHNGRAYIELLKRGFKL